MIVFALASVVLATIALPHLLPLRRADPAAAVALWTASLTLRALLGVFAVIWLVLYLPATALFRALTHWCWHAVVPLLATHLGFSGHRVVDAAIVLPALVLAASLISVGVGVWRVARSVQRVLASSALGRGPRDSLIVGGAGVLVAAAGLSRPRVVISAGALAQLDDEELAAALDHERGHIARRHRFLLVHAELCRALGRFVPGTRRAVKELGYHLERDADRWALRGHDRFALASAILKAARCQHTNPSPALASLAGGNDVEERLGELVADHQGSRLQQRLLHGLAAFAVTLTLGIAASVPPTLAAGLQLAPVAPAHSCPG